jgi:hypothetical protein
MFSEVLACVVDHQLSDRSAQTCYRTHCPLQRFQQLVHGCLADFAISGQSFPGLEGNDCTLGG